MRNYLYMIIWFWVFVFCEGTAGIMIFTAWTLDKAKSMGRKIAAGIMSGWQFRNELLTEG